MGRYREQGFIEGGDIDVRDLGNGEILMNSGILCSNGTRIDVTKTLRIFEGSGASVIVQTVDYSYCAVLSGVGNIFRYCAPHGAADGVPHHPHIITCIASTCSRATSAGRSHSSTRTKTGRRSAK